MNKPESENHIPLAFTHALNVEKNDMNVEERLQRREGRRRRQKKEKWEEQG